MKRRFVPYLFFGAAALFAPPLYAAFINDSDVIDIEYIGGTVQSESGFKSPSPPAPSGSEAGSVIILNSNGTVEEAPSSPQIPFVSVSSDTASFAPTTSAGSGAPSTSTSTTSSAAPLLQVSSSEIVAILIQNQAVSILGSSALGGVGSGGNLHGAAGLRFNGNRLRGALHREGIFRIDIPGGDVSLLGSGGRLTQNDFAIIVSQALLQDEHIGDVTFWNDTLSVRYRALGRLFGFLPLRYTMTTVVAVSKAPSVTLRFPWYSFILAKGVSEKRLQANIADAAATAVAEGVDSYDLATRIFKATAEILTRELGGF